MNRSYLFHLGQTGYPKDSRPQMIALTANLEIHFGNSRATLGWAAGLASRILPAVSLPAGGAASMMRRESAFGSQTTRRASQV